MDYEGVKDIRSIEDMEINFLFDKLSCSIVAR